MFQTFEHKFKSSELMFKSLEQPFRDLERRLSAVKDILYMWFNDFILGIPQNLSVSCPLS